ncbi:MAG TPA: hypothetical protein DDZ96_06235 [Porphyromonadaceae bacterium]|jgi:hypothetical protein|uniref:hypothetical protein n=1 Tax=Limibacterium fermenti TaxID=3229863 RepID=UPI000E92D362|nr:hypothetical protein [Porphyromonadaceae bacterium]HBK30985.1 hypothetical protein [Porphyromonadaceae bacterium]HBL33405.1 hypothetical protein [Porphyromonadaceae bacterium]HBX44773.1 hypothetical protein [Porphyromonadaceae bacterium]HCM19372.1 hypothetical protein [Porphyromonadaceae bacterium]
MKQQIILFTIVLALFATGCSSYEDYRISQSIFIEDVDSPGLPIYSEWGYNTFGAYWDRTPFISEQYDIPTKIIVEAGATNWHLMGHKNGPMQVLTFSFPGYAPTNYNSLISLKGKTFDLTGNECTVSVNESIIEILEGSISFKQAQKLSVDKELMRVIVSGTFHLKGIYNNEPFSLTSGRFDLGIGEDNFFFLNRK